MVATRDTCAACGRPVVAVPKMGPPITLDYMWVHVRRWRDRFHRAVPTSYVAQPDD